ncbi:MAG: flagellar hook-length control protein FliK [Pseudobdellovibrio sp.]
MLENLVRVGPPQGTNVLDSKEVKDFKTSKVDKQEFKSLIKKSMKEDHQPSKQSSGGTKRKMTEADKEEEPKKSAQKVDNSVEGLKQLIISEIMVSNEGETEIADSDKYLPEIEETDLAQNTEQLNMAYMVAQNQKPEAMHLTPSVKTEENVNAEPILGSATDIKSHPYKHLNSTEVSLMNEINQLGQQQVQLPVQNDLYANNAAQLESFQASEDHLNGLDAEGNPTESIFKSTLVDGEALEANSSDPKDAEKGEISSFSKESRLSHEISLETEKSFSQDKSVQNDEAALNAKSLNTLSQAEEKSDVKTPDKMSSHFESKVFAALSKESEAMAKPVVDKNIQNHNEGVAHKVELNNFTETVQSAYGSKESSQERSFSEEQSLDEQAKDGKHSLKADTTQDLSHQISTLQSQNSGFRNHLNSLQSHSAEMKAGIMEESQSNDGANVREIMNQAKFLVTRGGGEMTVKMTPEGMGEVHLKVMLDNGKINIEMNSHDKSVKKMIEESLSDLKSSLATHNMQVDHVKINQVTAVDTQNQTNTQSDMKQSFSNQSGQQNQNMNFSDMNGSNSERNVQGRQGLSLGEKVNQKLVTAKPHISKNPYVGGNKGATINMIA